MPKLEMLVSIQDGLQKSNYKKRTAKKPARFCVTPIRVATTPHTKVKVGSHSFGVVLLRTMLQGIWYSLAKLSLRPLRRYFPQTKRNQWNKVSNQWGTDCQLCVCQMRLWCMLIKESLLICKSVVKPSSRALATGRVSVRSSICGLWLKGY